MAKNSNKSDIIPFLKGMAVGAGIVLLREAYERKNPEYTLRQILVNLALDRALEKARRTNVRILDADTRFILFSDMHKGARDLADDFLPCEATYLRALDYYEKAGYTLIVLGDGEELWEQDIPSVIEAYGNVLASEARFYPERYIRLVGNHDDPWEIPELVERYLFPFFPGIEVHTSLALKVVEGGAELGEFFLVHGHQGTIDSDMLGFIGPQVLPLYRRLQNMTGIGRTSPSEEACLRAAHDTRMYRWSSRQGKLILIAGHTHRPVWSSRTHLEKLLVQLYMLQERKNEMDPEAYGIAEGKLTAEIAACQEKYPPCEDTIKTQPSYFNTGCCRFADGDITGIELADGQIRLIKWDNDAVTQKPIVLEKMKLQEVFGVL
jgi:hypothetical protein